MLKTISDFPANLRHSSGRKMTLNRQRLLLAFKKPHQLAEVENWLRESNSGLILEDAAPHTKREFSRPRERINHTKDRWWVRSQNRRPLTSKHFRVLNTRKWWARLAWIAPVYRLTHGMKGLLSPLPNALFIKPGWDPKATGGDEVRCLCEKLDELGFQEVPETWRLACGYWYARRKDTARKPVYQNPLRLPLTDRRGKNRKILVEKIEYDIMPMVVSTAGVVPKDEHYSSGTKGQWNMRRIKAGADPKDPLGTITGWDISTGQKVKVCVLDLGCDLTHPDLHARFSDTGINLEDPSLDGSADPTNAHGTACAGILGASMNNKDPQGKYIGVAGVAPECDIIPIKLVKGTRGELAKGIEEAVKRGADVISFSHTLDAWEGEAIDQAIENAWASGVLICAATGDDGKAQVRYPAKHHRVIACGAIDINDQRASFSNYGKNLSVVAPGVAIPTTANYGQGKGDSADNNYYLRFWGTSAAAPHVAGLAALLISRFPHLRRKPAEVRSIIEQSAEELPGPPRTPYTYPTALDAHGDVKYPHTKKGWNSQVGFGLINVLAALK